MRRSKPELIFRLLFLIVTVVYMGGLFLVIAPSLPGGMFLEIGELYAVIILASIPSFFFIIANHFYMNKVHGEFASYTALYCFQVVGTLLFLMAPFVWVLVRQDVYSVPDEHQSAANIAALIFACVYIFTMVKHGDFFEVVSKEIKSRIPIGEFLPAAATYLHRVMWDAWGKVELKSAVDPGFDNRIFTSIRDKRSPLYQDKEGLLLFQSTLSCPVYDSIALKNIFDTTCKEVVAYWNSLERPIKLLDIGGGEGEFTSRIVRLIKEKGIKIKSIKMLDPVDWDVEYKDAIYRVDQDIQVDVGLEKYSRGLIRGSECYDLVIASHSLYDALDSLRADHSDSRDILAEVTPLFECLSEGGVTLINLASNRSVSWGVKVKILRDLFSNNVSDVSAEKVYSSIGNEIILTGGSVVKQIVSENIDNIFLFSDIFNSQKMGEDSDKLLTWLRYYLRVNTDDLGKTMKEYLIDNALSKMIRIAWLAECDYKKALKELSVASNDIHQNSMAMMHKTNMSIYRKKIN